MTANLIHHARAILARLDLANTEGDPVASALLPGFRAAIREAEALMPEAVPNVDVRFTCESGGIHGSTSAPVKNVSWHDDGTLCVELDHWPNA